jgi:hypothetical protein
MSEPIYHANKLVITADQADQGFKLLGGNFDFAFVQTNDENQLFVIPIIRDLKNLNVKFDAVDFLKFREGRNPVHSPWRYLMCINGLFEISIEDGLKYIEFLKMPEFQWSEILPELKDTLQTSREQLLKKNNQQ